MSDNRESKVSEQLMQAREAESNKKLSEDFSESRTTESFEVLSSDSRSASERLTPAEKSEPRAQVVASAPSVDALGSVERKNYSNIEKILEEDLAGIYMNLSPKDQQNFKEKGEETAQAIFDMVYRRAKVQIRKVVDLIRRWLKTIPGINKYFLEQEAKIKADRIAEIAVREGKKVDF
ncbi:MAG: hypothetical protein BWY53_00192 [Parcubacteria group bacterium ADurb.Bin326]|nr:MAG: hypothetical protein BWY53_00192 [Parcubacteria group bacterium ADurb.Bin326]